MIKYLTDKKNIPYLILLIIGITVATYEYGFTSAIVVFGGLILISILIGLLIKYFIK